MRATRLNKAIVVGLGALLLGGVTSVYAATSVIRGVGTMAHFEPFDGPATMTARSLLSNQMKCCPGSSTQGSALSPSSRPAR